jgi:hypothetical protein
MWSSRKVQLHIKVNVREIGVYTNVRNANHFDFDQFNEKTAAHVDDRTGLYNITSPFLYCCKCKDALVEKLHVIKL